MTYIVDVPKERGLLDLTPYMDFCSENCKGTWNIMDRDKSLPGKLGIWFSDRADAVSYKLKFNGTFRGGLDG